MTVIEADRQNTIPHTVDSLNIYAGQRYSIAILRYAGALPADPGYDPTTPPPSISPLNEVDLHPLVNPAAPGYPGPGGADVNINLVTTFNFTTFMFEMNGVPFIPPTVPVLLQILSGAQAVQDLLPKGSIYALPPNKVIEISIPGTDAAIGGPVPHEFSVIRSAGSSDYNYVNPIKRDTVNGGFATDNTTIRFVTDNAGPWFFHCSHLVLDILEDWKDLCPIYDNLTPEQLGA
ncbi:hypothetical protein H0H92_010581 [Tricholoma furcatifolium]|nr:hypothetical protein H0H92_010581 [Tricholoma furcatifolium]